MKYKDRDELVASLREFADFIENKGLDLPILMPHMKLTSWLYDDYEDSSYDNPTTAKEKARRAVLALGKAEKNWSEGWLDIRKDFGCIELEFTISRESVCERKVVGFKDIPERVIEAQRQEIIEWECVDSILAT